MILSTLSTVTTMSLILSSEVFRSLMIIRGQRPESQDRGVDASIRIGVGRYLTYVNEAKGVITRSSGTHVHAVRVRECRRATTHVIFSCRCCLHRPERREITAILMEHLGCLDGGGRPGEWGMEVQMLASCSVALCHGTSQSRFAGCPDDNLEQFPTRSTSFYANNTCISLVRQYPQNRTTYVNGH